MQCFGTFRTAAEAARVYDLAVRHISGEDAVLNYPLTDYLGPDRELTAAWAAKVPAAALDAKARGAARKGSRKRRGASKASARSTSCE